MSEEPPRDERPPPSAEEIELIARRAHGQWRRRRVAEGWRCGPRRDEQAKEDSSLFDFELLPPADRDYLQAIVQETLQAALTLGWQPPPPAGHVGATSAAAQPTTALDAPLVPPEVLEDWQALKAAGAGTSLDDARHISEGLLRLGEPVMAYDFTLAALESHPRDVRLRQLQALALSRCGVPGRANALLRELRDEGHADEETLGLLARTYKDLWSRATDPAAREANLRQAHELYLFAYRSTGGVYSGINSASTALWLGDRKAAAELAGEVRTRCLADLERTDEQGDPYWTLATLGEACLLDGDLDAARQWYTRAVATAKGRFGDLHSTRRQARLVLGGMGFDPQLLDATLPMPKVALFCGWPRERPGRAAQRFSASAEADASAAIQRTLLEHDVGIGFASVASDAEVLFFESLRKRQGLAYAVLPFERDALQGETAALGPWTERFEAALREATQVHTVSEFGVPSNSTALEYAQALMFGLARLQADNLDTDLIGLAVDGDSAGRQAVERWRQRGLEVKTLGLPGMPDQGQPEAMPAELAEVMAAEQPASRIVAILFADVKGFSKLNEGQVPLFFQHFMGLVAKLLASMERPALLRNTWGDGLYVVFESVRDAGLFALELCERSACVDWHERGLPADLAVRIALHAGPAWHCDDPVMGAPTYSGIHVSRAARIEPITPPGQVYASQAFAALAASEGARELAFEYVGRTPLAKAYGTLPIYHVRRRE